MSSPSRWWSTQAWRWPQIRLGPALLFLAIFAAVGFLQASAVRVAMNAESNALPLFVPYLGHLTGALGAWIALPIVQTAVINAPGPRVGIARMIAIHAGGYLAFTIVQ